MLYTLYKIAIVQRVSLFKTLSFAGAGRYVGGIFYLLLFFFKLGHKSSHREGGYSPQIYISLLIPLPLPPRAKVEIPFPAGEKKIYISVCCSSLRGKTNNERKEWEGGGPRAGH